MSNFEYIKNIYTGALYFYRNRKISSKAPLGINYFRRKIIKHRPVSHFRKYRIFNSYLFYINGRDFLHSVDEIFINEIYKCNLPNRSYIIDCGANIGLSVVYFKSMCPDARVVAFEPDSLNFQLLSKNIDSFSFQNVNLINRVVWVNNNKIAFIENGNIGSRITQNENLTGGETFCECFRLKDLLVEKVDFLKIDIEGAEYEVLLDIETELMWVENMFIEYHGNFKENFKLLKILSIIEKAGMKYYIKEACNIYSHPFLNDKKEGYDMQLNIFCFRK